MNLVFIILSLLSNIIIIIVFLFLLYLFLKNNYLLSFAFRNIFRNKRRSIITICAISIGSIAIIVFGGFISDMFYGLRESTIRSQTGHFQIYKKGYNEFSIIDQEKYKMYDFYEIKKAIEEDEFLKDEIETIVPVVEFSGLISTGENSTGFIGRGVDIEKDREFSSFDNIKEGQKLNEKDNGKVSMGYLLAKKIGVKIGDNVSILISTNSIGLNVIDSEVKGTTESFSSDYDKVILKMSIDDAWKLLGEKYIDKFIILIKNSDNLDKVINHIELLNKNKNLNIEFRTWVDLAVYYQQVKTMYNGIFNFVKWIICIMVIIFITNTLFMSVMERVGETGTIRTIGTTKNIIVISYIIEGVIMGIIGGIIGIILSYLISMIINIFGIPMPPPPGSSKGYTSIIRFDKSSISYIFFSFKLSIIMTFLGSLLPAKKSIDMDIVDAMRHY